MWSEALTLDGGDGMGQSGGSHVMRMETDSKSYHTFVLVLKKSFQIY